MSNIKKIPAKIWIVILLSYFVPLWIGEAFTLEWIRRLRWFLYMLPVFFFAYYYGLLTNKLRALAIKDPLTQLFNRRYVTECSLDHRQVSVLFIDLDRFKFINDSLGHRIGDLILQSVSNRLKALCGEQDTLARLGGDEFILIINELRKDKIKDRAEAILNQISAPFMIEDHELYLSASIGICQKTNEEEEIHQLVAKADIAMFRAKQQGKNQYQFYIEEMNVDALKRLDMEKHLHRAIEKEEFELYYQPRVNLKTNQIIGMEALIRWHHPDLGLVTPQMFIPIAEETGLIVPLGEWVLHRACKQNKEWQDAGFAPLRVSVNISARQFEQNLAGTVERILAQTGLDPQWLELEITESLLMKNVEEAAQTLYQLKRIGVYLSIDDFGTGYSSLSYLKRFPIDYLKIDRSFVSDILADVSIAKAVVMLGHSLKMEVIAEGIEEKEQAFALQVENCNHGQGYLYSPPIPGQQFETILMGNLNFVM